VAGDLVTDLAKCVSQDTVLSYETESQKKIGEKPSSTDGTKPNLSMFNESNDNSDASCFC